MRMAASVSVRVADKGRGGRGLNGYVVGGEGRGGRGGLSRNKEGFSLPIM